MEFRKPTKGSCASPNLTLVRGHALGMAPRKTLRPLCRQRVPGVRPTSLSGVRHHGVQIQQVPRPERLFRPFERGLELHPHEIPDFPVDAVPHAALERLFGFIPVDVHAQRNGLFHLQTCPRRADILQDCCSLALASRAFFPANLYHVRAQHTNFRSPLAHTSHIGGRDRGLYTPASAFGLERVLFSISCPRDIIED